MKGMNILGLGGVFLIVLNVMNGISALFGIMTGYFGIADSNEIDIPLGMDNQGLMPVFMVIIGYFGLAVTGLALLGIYVLNFGRKSHKVFFSVPYGFVALSLFILGVCLPIIKSSAANDLREMYNNCCLVYEECCVKDAVAKANMDALHRRYNCCAFDGPDYFRKPTPKPSNDILSSRSGYKIRVLPESCCPKPADADRCPSKNARRRRQRLLKEEILKRQRHLEKIQLFQHTGGPCEVVVLDSDSEDNIEISSGEDTEERLKLNTKILKKVSFGGETNSGVSIKIRNLEELLSTDGSRRSNVGADGQFPGPSTSEERTPDDGEGIRIKDFFSLADERLKNQLQTAESRLATKTSDVQNVTDCIDADATQSCSSGRNSGSHCSGSQTIYKIKQLDPRYVQHCNMMVTPKVPGLSHSEVDPATPVDSANPIQQSDPNRTEKVLIPLSKTMPSVNLESEPGHRMEMGTLKSHSADAGNIKENKKAGNEISTPVTVEAKPSDVRVAIRVKDISLLTDKYLKSDGKTVSYDLTTENDGSGIVSESSSETFGSTLLDVQTSGNTISTSITVDKLTDVKVAIRVRDISSLTANLVGNQPNNSIDRVNLLHGPKILKPQSCSRSRVNLLPGLSGSVGISTVVPVDKTFGVRLPVRVRDISSLTVNPGGIERVVVNNAKIDAKNAEGRRLLVSGSSNLHANSTVDNSDVSAKRKKPIKPKKPKKHKPNKVDSQLNPNFQNFRQPLQMQRSIPAQSSADSINVPVDTPRPHFYYERSSSSMVNPRLQNQFTDKNAFTRNKNLDKAVIQEMRIERRKLRKLMRRQWKQSQQNCSSSHVPSHSNQTDPHRGRSSQNQPQSSMFHHESTQFRNQQLSETRWTFPLSSDGWSLRAKANSDRTSSTHLFAPRQRIDGTSSEFEPWQTFGVASGSISRDSRLQRSFVSKPDDSSCASQSRKNLNSSSKPKLSELGAVGGGEGLESNTIPATKRNSDAINDPSSTTTVQSSSLSIVASQSSTNTHKTTTPSPSGVKRSKDTPAASSTSELSKMPKTGSSSEPPSSETPSNQVSSASLANPRTSFSAKLPWTELSDTSWSSLFYK